MSAGRGGTRGAAEGGDGGGGPPPPTKKMPTIPPGGSASASATMTTDAPSPRPRPRQRGRSLAFLAVLGAACLAAVSHRALSCTGSPGGFQMPKRLLPSSSGGGGKGAARTERGGGGEKEGWSNAPVTWADREAGSAAGRACREMLPWDLEGPYLSYAVAWESLRPAVLNASYYPERYANLTRFRGWVSHLFGYYTYERLRRSQAHPAPPASVREILNAIGRRLEDPVHNGPVRIVVMGGSVTSGRSCAVNPLDLPENESPYATHRWCAYSQRLEVLLNRVLFPSRPTKDNKAYPVFEVTNMAVQATNSQVGAMALEYNLIPALEQHPPHVVISSYSANDARDADEAATFQVHQQDFVRAAHLLRPFTRLMTTSLANTGSLYKTASWYNLMAVMYSNVVRGAAVANSNFTDNGGGHPLFGSTGNSRSHLGMGFHIGQAWTLFFNLAGAMHEACTDPSSPPPPPPLPPSSSEGEAAVLPNVDGDEPPLPKADQPAWQLIAEEPPAKYMGRYHFNGQNVLREWSDSAARKGRLCGASGAADDEKETGAADRPPYSTSNCPYAWVVNSLTSVWTGEQVDRAVKYVLVDSVGWGPLDRQPKSGWFVDGANRSTEVAAASPQPYFTVELHNITMDIDTFTLLSLKSYGPDWVGSKLRIDVSVVPGSDAVVDSGPGKQPLQAFFVDGYHDSDISVSYPSRLRLGGAGARAGDTIRAAFTLVGGTTFVITGMAFCQSRTGSG